MALERKYKNKKWMEIWFENEIISNKDDKNLFASKELFFEQDYFVDFEFIIKKLGGTADYNPTLKELTLVLENNTLKCKIDDKNAFFNGELKEINSIINIENRLFGSINTISELFNKPSALSMDEESIILLSYDIDMQEYILYTSYIYGTQLLDPILDDGDFEFYINELKTVFLSFSMYAEDRREGLRDWWEIYDRESALDTIRCLYDGMHKPRCEAEILDIDNVADIYKKELLEHIKNRWGDKNILAWDLSRAVYLAADCYGAGYITFDEYINLSLPGVKSIQNNFNNWEDYNENRLDGFKYWTSEWKKAKRRKNVNLREKATEVLLRICKETAFQFDKKFNIQERNALTLEDLRRKKEIEDERKQEIEKFENAIWEEFLSTASPKEIHQSVITSNWDENKYLLNWIKNNPNIDKATALVAYWMSGPNFLKQYETRKDAEKDFSLEDFDFIEEIEQKYLDGFWKNSRFEYDPTNDLYGCSDDDDCGYDWTKEYIDGTIVREIPSVMYKKLEGEKLEYPDNFEEGLPKAYMQKIYDYTDEIEDMDDDL